MFAYYLGLGLRSLRSNIVLTLLMVGAIGVGIAAFTTTLTVMRVMGSDPIPQKSRQLFAPQIDNWGPDKQGANPTHSDLLENQLSYADAKGLMDARAAKRQTAMYATAAALTPGNRRLKPFTVQVRGTGADFFAMFLAPFKYGSAWRGADDAANASVTVLSKELNDKLFEGRNSVGQTVNLDGRDYRVVGVLDRWKPVPRFYDLNSNRYGKSEELFLPFSHAIDRKLETTGNDNCTSNPEPGWVGHLSSECVWIQFWVELPTAQDVERYRRFLGAYAAEQQRAGRFQWVARTQLRDVREWLRYEGAVSDEARMLFLLSVSFLLVCLLNAVGLMLAKTMGRSKDIGLRRAVGASRGDILAQCLMESAVVGLVGALLGLTLAIMSLAGLRSLLSDQMIEITHLDFMGVSIAIVVAISATMLAGLYPTWRASRIQPSWQLKAL